MEDKVLSIAKHISAIMEILNIPETESNKDTPMRVAKMYCNELFKNRSMENYNELLKSMTLFDNEGTTTPITISNIAFSSTCEHHWLPFMGVATVSYIPKSKIIGLSKIPRVVKYFSKMPQLQERLTNDIGYFLRDLLNPIYLKVTLESTHTCVMCRGAESDCVTTTTFEYSLD